MLYFIQYKCMKKSAPMKERACFLKMKNCFEDID